MTGNGILQIALYFLVLLALTKPLGAYMAKVFAGERTFLHPRAAAARGGPVQALRHRRKRRAALDQLCRRRCWPSAW